MLSLFLCLAAAVPQDTASAPARPEFERDFTGRTLRLDTWHSSSPAGELVSLHQFRLEGPWAGRRKHLAPPANLGAYRFEVHASKGERLLYGDAYNSVYGEWATTKEALAGRRRTFHESLRFPEPRQPVRIAISKRSKSGLFEPLYSIDLDPADPWIARYPIRPSGMVRDISIQGEPATKVDLLFLSDGYTPQQRGRFEEDVQRLCEILFQVEPYRSRRADFNIRSRFVPASAEGIPDPLKGRWIETPLGSTFSAFALPRYVLSFRNLAIREAAAEAPYDNLVILANSERYGGGGIYNLYCICTVDSGWEAYLFLHEFGHAFAALGDEYYSSQIAYEDLGSSAIEPWEPNLTALLDPRRLKWRDLVRPGTPLPTPWPQSEYDARASRLHNLPCPLQARKRGAEPGSGVISSAHNPLRSYLESLPRFGAVGAFEGAGYRAKGLYRPELDCIMFARTSPRYCRVCQRAIRRAIDRLTR